jgi:DNA (cytosine-5)-methyltransferase 1
MKIGSLCTGYGGLDLAVEAHFNAKTIWCAEFDKYASQVIEQRFNIPNHGNIKEIDWASVEPIDILTAGYPCQPFSQAGYRKGTDDERHIFPYIKEAISILRPRWVILENVRGHLSLGLKEVLAALTSIGYDAKWQVVRASDTGAPHQRARIFIIAYPNGFNGGVSSSIDTFTDSTNDGFTQRNSCGHAQTITRFKNHGLSASSSFRTQNEMAKQDIPNVLESNRLNPKFVEYMMGLPIGWVTETGLSRAQQLKMLGNGVVPQQAKYALEIICP